MKKNSLTAKKQANIAKEIFENHAVVNNTASSISFFKHYKNNNFNLVKKDIIKMRLVKKRDNFFSIFFFLLSALFVIIFFNIDAFVVFLWIGSNLVFNKIVKVYAYDLLVYYKNSGFTKINLLKNDVTEAELLIKSLK